MKLLIILLLLTISMQLTAQQTKIIKTPLTKADYMEKSIRQKSTAWVLLGGGSALIVVGVLVGTNKNASFGNAGTGVIVGGLGFLSTLGSIPLFLASSKNRKKGISLSLKDQRDIHSPIISLMHKPIPSLSISLSL